MGEAILRDYWRSSAAYRVRIGLNLLGLPSQILQSSCGKDDRHKEGVHFVGPEEEKATDHRSLVQLTVCIYSARPHD